MAEPFIGEIRLLPYSRFPIGWIPCDGRLLQIAENTALYSIVGTLYGGNGVQTFGVPNLKGLAVMGTGQGPRLTPRQVSERTGAETIALLESQLPSHNHDVNVYLNAPDSATPEEASLGISGTINTYVEADPDSSTDEVDMSDSALAPYGSNAGHENRQPFLVLNYFIAYEGIYPPRQ